MSTLTLRKALTQAKCSVPYRVKGRNTRDPAWPGLDIYDGADRINAWEEFTIENLNASYGHILDQTIPEGRLKVPETSQALGTVEITKPEHVNHLIEWSDGVVVPTLEFARGKLHIDAGTSLKSRFASPDKTGVRPGFANKNRNGRIKVDHLIELDDRLPTLLVGLGRPSNSFPGRHLVEGCNKETIWPLRQLANLCLHSQTRFGYVLAEQDLVACCFSAEDPKARDSAWSVAVMPVPWTKSGPGHLTTDLALWWLCMLTISAPRNRQLTRRDHMSAIDGWDLHMYDDERGWVRRHKYSKFEEPTDEPLPPPYQSPSPGNAAGTAAVLAAEVGINLDPDFDLFPLAAADAVVPNLPFDENLNQDDIDFGLGDLADFNFNAPLGPDSHT